MKKFASEKLVRFTARFMAVMLLLAAFTAAGFFTGEKVSATPPPTSDQWVRNMDKEYRSKPLIDLFTKTKTLDLSKSNISIKITDEDKKKLFEQADEGVFKWLCCVAYIEIINSGDYYMVGNEDRFNSAVSGIKFSKGGIPYYSPKYWYEDVFEVVKANINGAVQKTPEEEIKEKLRLLKKFMAKFSTGTTILDLDPDKDKEYVGLIRDHIGTLGNDPGALGVRAKREEIYNDRFSDLLNERISGKLNAKFSYEIEEISSDGSEDEKYGIGTLGRWMNLPDSNDPEKIGATIEERVFRGKLHRDSIKLSTVNFGAKEQLYDQILKEDVETIQSGNNIFPLASNDKELEHGRNVTLGGGIMSWGQAKEIEFGEHIGFFLPRDLRGFGSHVILIDEGRISASDDSSSAICGKRGTAEFPGWHCLQEVCDSLSTYSKAIFLKPMEFYKDAFNLHLNPAVNYYANDIKASLITDCKFDASGKLLSISKPLFSNAEFDDMVQSITKNVEDEEQGIYRYKLKETQMVPSELGGNTIVKDTSEKIVDVFKETLGDDYNDYWWQRDSEIITVNVFDNAAQAKKYYSDWSKYQERKKEWKMDVLSGDFLPKVNFTNRLVKKTDNDTPKNNDEVKIAEEEDNSLNTSLLLLRSKKQTGNSVSLTWNKVNGARKYVVNGGRCSGKSGEIKKTAKNKLKVSRLSGKKLKKGTYYKFSVTALDKDNNVIATSQLIHAATKGGKAGNHKSVTIKPKKAKQISVGKSFKLKAKAVKASKKLKVEKHAGIYFETSNPKVASVSKTGVVKGIGKGTCRVYAHAQNGIYKSIKVTVN